MSISEQKRRLAKTLYDKGWKIIDIAKEIGVHRESVNNILKQKTISEKEKADYEAVVKEKEERQKRIKELVKEEEVIFMDELEKDLATIDFSNNHYRPNNY